MKALRSKATSKLLKRQTLRMLAKSHSDWFSKNAILRPNSIMTQLKLPSPYVPPPLHASVLTQTRVRLPHCGVVLGPTLLWFLEHAQSPLRTFLLCGYVKMAASVVNMLLRRLPNISPFRGAYGVQVTPWGTFCTTSDLFVPSRRVVPSGGRRSTAGNPGVETFPSAYTLAVKETLCFHHPPPSPLTPQYSAFSNFETRVKSHGWMSFSSQVSVSAG